MIDQSSLPGSNFTVYFNSSRNHRLSCLHLCLSTGLTKCIRHILPMDKASSSVCLSLCKTKLKSFIHYFLHSGVANTRNLEPLISLNMHLDWGRKLEKRQGENIEKPWVWMGFKPSYCEVLFTIPLCPSQHQKINVMNSYSHPSICYLDPSSSLRGSQGAGANSSWH